MNVMAAARAAHKTGDSDAALALARRARLEAPQNPEPAFFLCRLLLERQDKEANTLISTLEAFGEFAPGWEELGHALVPARPDAAMVAFRRAAEMYAAMERRAPQADVAYRLGLVLRRLGQFDSARAAMERATERDPASAPAWFILGLLCQDLHDLPGAIRAFRTAVSARPDFHEAAFNLGVACQEAGDMDRALDAYAAAWRTRPDSFGRIAQALVSPAVGRLWLQPSALRAALSARP